MQLPSVGDRIRLSLSYDGAPRPLVWIRVGTDGSVYAGLLLGSPSTAISGSSDVVAGKARFDLKEGATLQEGQVPKSSRVSFKASGEIHMSNKIFRGAPLETLVRPRQLALMLFIHPARYRPPAKANANDYDVCAENYPFDQEHPVYGALFVAPWSKDLPISRVPVQSMRFQLDWFFGFSGLTRTPDLMIQVALGHGVRGSWPQLPVVAFREDLPDTSSA